ncbi:hypothetical protein [Paraflavitalea sp. CAU 1676]|uniref:hypothetical protein n=1 Tax=Paraflavitalea sp. CAU 1676 TaxID=3032598 RepID=UPI0023DAF123|nr:hypothetical protein [Paraflavitalea sp. CAU 1676]MDF2187654.1 hypothetical protein [Paraflavitalea sp. CAU 1676]
MARKYCIAIIGLLSFFTTSVTAQEKGYWSFVKNGSFYLSWGYNTEWYTRSTLHVKQPSLGNDYKLVNVRAHDHPGWDEGLFSKAMTIPQYNYRLGYFFNEKQDLAIEINFDHTKYIITDGQQVTVKGNLNGQKINGTREFSEKEGSYYYLNNGANFLLFNLVKKFKLIKPGPANNLKLDLLAKAGVGPVIPHVENSLFGQKNEPGFQIGGWNTGIETAFRLTAFRYAYIEFAQKVDYARYSNLKVYEGRARQAFGTYELILNLGFTIPTGKHNKEFARHIPVTPETKAE